MSRRRRASPLGPAHILVDSSSRLCFANFEKVYDATPSGYIVRYPRLDEPDPSQVDKGYIAIHYASLEVGLRFPLPPSAKEWLRHYRIVPAQLHPNGWAQLVGFSILCHQRDVVPSLILFILFLGFKKLVKTDTSTRFRKHLVLSYFLLFLIRSTDSKVDGW